MPALGHSPCGRRQMARMVLHPLARFGYVAHANSLSLRLQDMHYLLTYAEDDTRGGISSWKIRQAGVFHRYDPSGSGNLFILLHANPQSPLQRRIEHTIATNPVALFEQWFSMHLLVLSTYLGGWRWYIRNLGDEIEKTVCHTMPSPRTIE